MTREELLMMWCPYCGSSTGELCKAAPGRYRERCHEERLEEYLAVHAPQKLE